MYRHILPKQKYYLNSKAVCYTHTETICVMSYYLFVLVLFLAVISLTNGRNYSPPTGRPHIHPPPLFKPPLRKSIVVPSTPHLHPPQRSRPPPTFIFQSYVFMFGLSFVFLYCGLAFV